MSERREDLTEFEWGSPRWRDDDRDQGETERDRRARDASDQANEGAITHRDVDADPSEPES